MTAPTPPETPARPRREPWPLAILAFFAATLLLVIGFVAWSSSQPFELVSRDYYARELAHQQQIDDMQRAGNRPVPVRIRRTQDGRAIDLDLGASEPVDNGEIWLYRPSNAAWDRTLPLEIDHDGHQRIDTAGMQPGLWKVRIQWTEGGKTFYAEDTAMIEPIR